MDIPFRPAALLNFPMIDEEGELGNVAVNFWDLTWNNIKRYLPYETRLLLSLTNRERMVLNVKRSVLNLWKNCITIT